jgi:hypothetical protein
MDRIDALAEKIDAALRDDASGMAVFDMLPAWQEEYREEHGSYPGTSGGAIPLDHYMRETSPGDFDEDYADGIGNGIARLGRCVYRWHDSGRYESHVYPTTAEAKAEVEACAPAYDTGEEG